MLSIISLHYGKRFPESVTLTSVTSARFQHFGSRDTPDTTLHIALRGKLKTGKDIASLTGPAIRINSAPPGYGRVSELLTRVISLMTQEQSRVTEGLTYFPHSSRNSLE